MSLATGADDVDDTIENLRAEGLDEWVLALLDCGYLCRLRLQYCNATAIATSTESPPTLPPMTAMVCWFRPLLALCEVEVNTSVKQLAVIYGPSGSISARLRVVDMQLNESGEKILDEHISAA